MKWDVWLYSVVVEAEDEQEAVTKVQKMLDEVNVNDKFQVDFAEAFAEGE